MGYHNLVAWQLADELVHATYLLTDKIPRDEIFGVTSQLRRAVLSVVLNIIEGYSRNNKNEFRNFLRIALGSLAETGYLIEFCFVRKYFSKTDFELVIGLKERCGQVLWKLMKSQ